MSPIASSGEPALPPGVPSSSATSSGVANTPSRFDADALQTAAGTLPRAIAVNAIEDCTVEGRQHR